MTLSPSDVSIDILMMLIYWVALYRAVYSLWFNHIPFRHKIYLCLFSCIAILYTFQTFYQIIHNTFAPVIVWDVLNGFTVLAAFILTSATYADTYSRYEPQH